MNPPPPGPERPNPFEPPPVGSYGLPVPSYASAPPASSEAIAAIVCGVLAWTCFPLGFVAIWLGARARRAVRENPERVGGDQLALAGMIIGGIFGVLWLLFWLAYLGFFVFAISFGMFHK
ncbi:MAG TPA: DUF4190 domain-containing protein [Polyangiaceae bacterium]